MSKERTTPPEVTVRTDGSTKSLAPIAVDPPPPAVLLFNRYVKLLKGDPEKIWTFFSLELTRCQPGIIL